MFERLGGLIDELRAEVATLAPTSLRPEDAALLVELYSEVERLGVAGRTVAAGRVAQSSLWQREGHRTAANWLAAKIGTSVGHAINTLETARTVEHLPATQQALRSGALSEPQVKEIAAAAEADPRAESALLDKAKTHGLKSLQAERRRVRAAADPDETATYRRIHSGRYLRHWTDEDGAFRLDARLTPDAGARVIAAIDLRKRTIAREARRRGRRDPYQAYAADALVALAHEASSPDSGPNAMVHVLVDHAALVRGRTETDERCEIPGIGPIPVATARALASDSILKVLVTDGVDIKAVAHAGRTIPSHVRTAIEARDASCLVPGCDERNELQIDHHHPHAAGGASSYDNLGRLCPWHHYLKTYCGYRIDVESGDRVWMTPDQQEDRPDADARPPPAA